MSKFTYNCVSDSPEYVPPSAGGYPTTSRAQHFTIDITVPQVGWLANLHVNSDLTNGPVSSYFPNNTHRQLDKRSGRPLPNNDIAKESLRLAAISSRSTCPLRPSGSLPLCRFPPPHESAVSGGGTEQMHSTTNSVVFLLWNCGPFPDWESCGPVGLT
jgi:hypothetical protein